MPESFHPVTRIERIVLWAGLSVGAVLTLACFVVGGKLAMAAAGRAALVPVGAIALFAHLGRRFQWAELLSWLGAGFVLLLVYLLSIGMLLGSDPENPNEYFAIGAGVLTIAAIACAPLLAPPVRVQVGRVLGVQVDTPARHIGLFLTVSLSLLLLAPVLSTGQAIALAMIPEDASSTGLGAGGSLLMLAWTVPLAFILVGFGITRGTRQSWQRLGLEWRGSSSIMAGLGVAITLALVVTFSFGPLTELFAELGLPTLTDEQGELLFDIANMTALTAMALSIAAGVGEELIFRGALQPRVGILLANCAFTAMHAWQYTLDSLLAVFLVGLCMAYLRRRFGTWSCITAHFLYDLILLTLAIS